ncbi:MAG: hypothetical protein ACR2QU_09170 [Gammaproteobacteria bacterium]
MRRMPVLLPLILLLTGQQAAAEWEADPADKVQTEATLAIEAFRDRVPRTQPYFEQAHGFAVFPSIIRVGFGFGGAYGKGIVLEGNELIGTSKYKQITSGIQAGARSFSMIIFFKDKEALEYYKSSEIQFMGQAGLNVGTLGADGTPAYDDGVAVITLNRFGLMGEFTVSGAKFSYQPLISDDNMAMTSGEWVETCCQRSGDMNSGLSAATTTQQPSSTR